MTEHDEVRVLIEASAADAADGPGLYVSVHANSNAFHEHAWLPNPSPHEVVTIVEALEWAVETLEGKWDVDVSEFSFSYDSGEFTAPAKKVAPRISRQELRQKLYDLGIDTHDAMKVEFNIKNASTPFIKVYNTFDADTIYYIKED